jgi:RNA polymerase sigma-70 factor (ECF subfamily)
VQPARWPITNPPDSLHTDQQSVEQVFRDAYGQAVATLVRVFGDIDLAEDAVQDAFIVAQMKWPDKGLPPNPAGWIVTTARRRAIDRLRRETRGTELLEEAGRNMTAKDSNSEDPGPVADDQLRLIFTCCHPALKPEAQVALTLRLLGGLEVEEIARAFLVPEPTMAKRLVRAKYKIKAAAIPYRIPNEADLPNRLGAVLLVLYLIYNTGADRRDRAPLRGSAIRLARVLVDLLSDQPEAVGMLALMLLNESRMQARFRTNGDGAEVVRLRDQNRDRWDRDLIEEGHTLVRDCIKQNQPGPFQLQAAIQAVHCDAATFEDTDWDQIVTLYNQLYAASPTPIVALNRAIAIGEVSGPAAALSELDPLSERLATYHLYHAARATALRDVGKVEAALDAFEQARELAETDVDIQFLDGEITALANHDGT